MQANQIDSLLSSPLIAVVFFAIAWSLICYFVSWTSGWLVLSKRFGSQSEPYGDIHTAGPFFYTVYTRYWSHYGGVIRMTAAADGLYLSMLFIFRVGHAPLRIPWNEIQVSRTTRFWRKYVVLTLGNQEQIPMRISERMARKLRVTDRIPQEPALAQGPAPIV